MIIENGSSITKRKIKSSKWIVFICAVLALLSDLFAVLLMAFNGYNILNYLVPLVMAVIDVLFILTVILSDFRFRYSNLEFTLYCLLVLTGSFLGVYLNKGFGSIFGLENTIAMTKVASILWYVIHALVCLSVIFSSLYAVRFKKSKRIFLLVLSLVLTAVLGAFTYLYCGYLLRNGFYGQGALSETERSLVYTYDEEEDTYSVTGLVNSSGNTITIPTEFNGKSVTSVDCSVFAEDGITKVYFEGEVVLENTTALKEVSSELTISADKEFAEDYKQTFYALSYSLNSQAVLSLANSITPTGLDEDEVYITFTVSEETYDILGGDIPSIWYGTKGGSFYFASSYSSYTYFSYTNATSDSDLYWAYTNNGGYILNTPSLSDGSALNGSKVSESATVELSFSKVYRFSFGEGNDSMHTLSTSYTQTTVGANTYNYRYTVLNNADGILSGIARTGYTLSWYYTKSGSSTRYSLSTLSSAITYGGNNITVYPKWQLNSPTVSLSADNSTVTYGSDVTLTAVAGHSADGILYSYEWEAADGTITSNGTSQYAMSVPTPSQSGTYTVTVTAYSDSATSLTNTTTKTINITINKKALAVIWTLPADLTYSGTAKTLTCSLTQSEIVNGDSVSLVYSFNEIKNAGSYSFSTALDSDSQLKYTLTNPTCSFSVTPYALTLEWDATSFTYSGSAQVPTASATGVGSDGTLEISVSGEKTNAGSYTATASTDNGNYTIDNAAQAFTISPYSLTVAWSNTSFTYNGYEQSPTATATGVGSDGALTINVTGAKDAGTHTATASIDNGNYTIDNATQSFTIIAYELTVMWSNTSLTYNGGTQAPTATATGVGTDVISISVSGGAKNVGTDYTATASISDGNYTISDASETQTFAITAYSLTVTWYNTTLTYSGSEQKPTATATGVGSDGALEISVSGGQTSAGTYNATASISNANYTISNSTQSFTIEQYTLTLTWDGTSFEYDGNSHAPTATASAISGDSITITVSGGAKDAGNYTATASVDNTNYTINNPSCQFTVTARSIEVTWNSTEFTYDGSSHIPTATATGVDNTALTITVTGSRTNAGNYIATASIADANYTITNSTQSFTIAKCEITLTWNNTSLTYNGSAQAPTATYSGNPQPTITVTGTGVNVGTYTATASAGDNYTITNATCQFTITAAQNE